MNHLKRMDKIIKISHLNLKVNISTVSLYSIECSRDVRYATACLQLSGIIVVVFLPQRAGVELETPVAFHILS